MPVTNCLRKKKEASVSKRNNNVVNITQKFTVRKIIEIFESKNGMNRHYKSHEKENVKKEVEDISVKRIKAKKEL